MLYNTNNARSINRPLPTVTAKGNHIGICKPFLIQYNNNSKPHSVEKPIPTQSTRDRFALCNPFLVYFSNNHDAKTLDEPAPTLTTKEKLGLCEPFIIGVGGPKGSQNPRSINKPLNTVISEAHAALISPFILGQQSCSAPRSINNPIPTIAGAGAISLIQPKINGQTLDIHFRMLKPHELARAMSFDDNYKFEGNREAQVKQIGNAVPVMVAKALCKGLLN
jgi:DNA (cytosine-5)-methyltransferase 1